jgi:hypothetical protein
MTKTLINACLAVKRFKLAVKRFFRLGRLCRTYLPPYSPRFPAAWLRAARLCRRHGYGPDEAFVFGVFNPAMPDEEADEFLSRKEWLKVHDANPRSWLFMVKDKSVFYRHCAAVGLPVPELYALYFRGAAGWSPSNRPLSSREDWSAFIEGGLPEEFVLKPAVGAFGRGVRVFARAGGRLVDHEGKSYAPGEVYDLMRRSRKDDCLVIQQRLRNHPDLLRISDTPALQTVRIHTVIDREGRCRIVRPFFKAAVGGNVADNMHSGMTGNIHVDARIEDGVLEPGQLITRDGRGIILAPVHPETGVRFEGIKLPFWAEAAALVTEAAGKFLPLRTLGWDVALTGEGPVIVEANFYWTVLYKPRGLVEEIARIL